MERRAVVTVINKTFSFSTALVMMKKGYDVCRINWHGNDMSVCIQEPDENSLMTLPYIYLTLPTGDRVPWLASQTDLLSSDWAIYPSTTTTSTSTYTTTGDN